MSWVAQAVVKDIGFEHLSHPPYLPDLAPSDFLLVPISTSEEAPLRNKVFWWWWAQAGYGVVSRHHAPGILFDWYKRTFDRCQKCIDVKGDYIEKYCNCFVCAICTSYWIAKLFGRPSYIHCESKKNWATFIFTVTLANVGRFLKFFHSRNQKEIADNKKEKFPTAP